MKKKQRKYQKHHAIRWLLFRWVRSIPCGISPHHGLFMLSERLSGRRIQVHPNIPWNRVSHNFKSLDWCENQLHKYPEVFRAWLKSGDAFEEIRPTYMAPQIVSRLESLEVAPREVGNVLFETPCPNIPKEDHYLRSLLWWHLAGMTVELLSELTKIPIHTLELDLSRSLDVLLGMIGCNLFAWRVDVACILGGDSKIPYLKRLLLAGSYGRHPMLRFNPSWKKCILPLYYRDPSLLRRLKGSGNPHIPSTLFWIRPRRDLSVAEEKEHPGEDPTHSER